MTLTGRELLARLNADRSERRLHLVPCNRGSIDPGEASIDLRLGSHFLLPRRGRQEQFDPVDQTDPWQFECARREGCLHPSMAGMEAAWLPADGHITLQPRDFLLAATLEYVGLPADLCAHVMGRSRWARVGLVVEMASFVHPGYRGCLTLEVQNLGSTPIVLRPGYRVAHLVVSEAGPADDRPVAQATCAIRPQVMPLLTPAEVDRYARAAGDGPG